MQAVELASDTIVSKLTTTPGNGASIGGLKVVTEDVYKLYAESFRGKYHIKLIQEEAQALITKVLASAK